MMLQDTNRAYLKGERPVFLIIFEPSHTSWFIFLYTDSIKFLGIQYLLLSNVLVFHINQSHQARYNSQSHRGAPGIVDC